MRREHGLLGDGAKWVGKAMFSGLADSSFLDTTRLAVKYFPHDDFSLGLILSLYTLKILCTYPSTDLK